MSETNYYNYRLYRTTPKLSGNMKWDLVLSKPSTDNMVWIKDFHLRPLVSSTPYTLDVTEDILKRKRTHQFNIKKFREATVSDFYSYDIDSRLSSDWPVTLTEVDTGLDGAKEKYIKNWDDTFWSGTQRMSYKMYGTTHEMLVPVWLEQCRGMTFKFKIQSQNPINNKKYDGIRTLILDLSPGVLSSNYDYKVPRTHKKFVKYLQRYLQYTSIWDGCNDLMKIDFDFKHATIRGLDARYGNIVTRIDNDIVKNLVFRERPLLEQNSILTNIFPDLNLIVPNLINFNFCFDFRGIMNSIIDESYSNTPTFKIYSETNFWRTDNFEEEEKITWQAEHDVEKYNVTVRDLYTNHEEIFNNFGDNILDYMRDYSVTEMIHKNKMVAPIPHWMIVDSNHTLFNTYKGFQDPGDIIDGNWHTWASLRYGDGYDIEVILNNPEKYISEGYLQDASSFMNGIKVEWEDENIYHLPNCPQYEPTKLIKTKVDKLYIGLMTTPPGFNYYDYKTGLNTLVTSKNYVAILNHYWGDNKKLMEMGEEFGEYRGIEANSDDYDVRNSTNSICTFICWENFKDDFGKNCIAVIFWTPSIDNSKGDLKDYEWLGPLSKGGRYNYEEVGKSLKYSELGIKSLSNLIDSFMSKKTKDENFKYLGKYEIFDYIDNLKGIFAKILKTNVRQLILFNNKLTASQDITLSTESTESKLYKIPNDTSFIKRYPSAVVPAMLPVVPSDADLEEYKLNKNADLYRHNFFYTKKFLLSPNLTYLSNRFKYLNRDEDILQYLKTGVVTKYPSLRYDSVQSILFKLKNKEKNILGGLDPDEGIEHDPNDCTCHEYVYDDENDVYIKELVADERNLWIGYPRKLNYDIRPDSYEDHSEYKWFDHSTVCFMPTKISIESTCVSNNSKEELDKMAFEQINKYLSTKENKFDIEYLKSIYCIDYYLTEVIPIKKSYSDNKNVEYETDPVSDEILYTYKYSVNAHLK